MGMGSAENVEVSIMWGRRKVDATHAQSCLCIYRHKPYIIWGTRSVDGTHHVIEEAVCHSVCKQPSSLAAFLAT